MKYKKIIPFITVMVLLLAAGCTQSKKSETVFEGMIQSIKQERESTLLLLENGDSQANVTVDEKTVIENGTNLITGVTAVVAFDGPVTESNPIQGKAARITLFHGMQEKPETVSAQTDVSSLEGINLYQKSEYDFNGDGISEAVGLYTAADLDANGDLMLDDGQDWALAVTGSDGMFPLFPRQYVQLGAVEYALYFSYEDEHAHVLVTLKQGTGIQIIDYSYNKAQNVFEKTVAFKNANINLMK